MSFLNPILLFGTLAIVVPITLHLLNRRRVERVRWAAMRFLRASVERNQRQMRLEDFLLLLLRCALLFLLAVALARPTLSGGGWAASSLGQPPVTALVLLDVSGSMQVSDGVRSRLDVAREAGAELLSSYPPGSRVALWAASDGAPTPIIAEPTADLVRVRQAMESLPATDRATDLGPALADALAWAARQPAAQPRELVLITDAQRSGLDLTPLPAALEKAKADARLTVVTVGGDAPPNLSISAIAGSAAIPAAGRPYRVTATVTNHGAEAARATRVVLRAGAAGATGAAGEAGGAGGGAVDEAVIPELRPGESQSVSLFARLTSAGPQALRAEIAADRAPFDDARTLMVRARPSVRVVIVEGPRASASAPETAPAFFLRQALVPRASAATDAPNVLQVEVAAAATASAERLAGADVIILADVSDLAPTLADAVVRRVRAGAGLMVFPGPELRPDTFTGELAELLPARLGDPVGDPTADRPRATFSPARPDHPISALWADKAAGDLTSARFFRTVPLMPREDSRLVLAHSDGAPAILERDEKLGRVLLFSSTANAAWNNLPLRPGIYVPLLHRSIASLIAADDAAYNLRPGPAIVASPPTEWVGREVEIFPPGADLTRPSLDLARVELGPDGRGRFTLPASDRAGAYRARLAGRAPADIDLLFAVSPAPSESDLACHRPDDLRPLSQWATSLAYSGPESLARVTSARAGTELFFPAAILVFLLAASETVFAFLFSRPK